VEARDRLRQEYRRHLVQLTSWTFEANLESYLDHAERTFSLVQPVVQPAIELGIATWQEQLDSGLTSHVAELKVTLRQLATALTEHNLQALGQAIRRAALCTMLDRPADFTDMRERLRALIVGYLLLPNRIVLSVGCWSGMSRTIWRESWAKSSRTSYARSLRTWHDCQL
jgi:hypothetical protein